MIYKFIELQDYSSCQQKMFSHILDFLLARAKGEVPTGAKFIRDYIH